METWWVTVLSVVLTFLASGCSVVTFILYRKQSVRIKNAEAFEKEVEALKKEIEALKDDLRFEREQRAKDKEVITHVEDLNTALHKENSSLEIKNAKNKKALNRGYECTFCPDSSKCPVLMQRKRNEDEYLIELQKKNNN